jgi:hypothetical protein
MGNDLNRSFTKEGEKMSKKHIKKFSTSLNKKEIQIKTTLRCHLTPVRMATIKNTNSNEYQRGHG